MNRVLLTVLLVIIYSQASLGQNSVTATEYSIYGIVLNSIDREYRNDNEGETQHYVILTKLFSSISVRRDAEKRFLFPDKLPVRHQYSLVDEIEIKGLIEKGEAAYKKEKEKAHSESKPMRFDMCGGSIWKYFYLEKHKQR